MTTRMTKLLVSSGLLLASGPVWAACGDGTLDSGETCDDDNTTAGDGCDASCQIETGWDCIQASFALNFSEDWSSSNNANWSLSSNGQVLTQTVNSEPGVYVSTLPVDNILITFTQEVETTSGD